MINPISKEPRLFTLYRHQDETGISGTGRVLDGVIFHNGKTVICWRSDISKNDPDLSSITIYNTWEAFKKVHVDSHGENTSRIEFFEL